MLRLRVTVPRVLRLALGLLTLLPLVHEVAVHAVLRGKPLWFSWYVPEFALAQAISLGLSLALSLFYAGQAAARRDWPASRRLGWSLLNLSPLVQVVTTTALATSVFAWVEWTGRDLLYVHWPPDRFMMIGYQASRRHPGFVLATFAALLVPVAYWRRHLRRRDPSG